MSTFRSIEIDLEVHKRIESERQSFAERPNDVLRRLLRLVPQSQTVMSTETKPAVGERPWTDNDLILPHSTKLRMTYNGRTHEGQIVDGKWLVDGVVYSSPSGAAIGAARTREGKSTRLNGWALWEAKRPTDIAWSKLEDLRPKTRTETHAELMREADTSISDDKERWVDDILAAFRLLGGSAKHQDLYRTVNTLRLSAGRSWPEHAEEAIRQTLQTYCSDARQYRGGLDLFKQLEPGEWALRVESSG